MVRIIAGRWRRKKLVVLDKTNLRPTPSKVRETLFNWLSSRIDLTSTLVLDLFCGSGALGFEAASRGAKKVYLIDSDRKVVDQLNQFINILENPKNIKIFCKEATEWLKLNQSCKFDLIFLDPPFDSPLLSETLPFLHNLVNEGGHIYVEYGKEIYSLFDSIGFEVVRAGKSGAVRYYLIKKNSSEF
mgnify:CR=1 FL=1|jgi:16S rRNA (guanine966-N2)-methyltransferase